MKTLFTTILLASVVISAPAFAEDAEVKDVLAGNATELSSTEMQTTEGAGTAIVVTSASNGALNISGADSFLVSGQSSVAIGTGIAGPFGSTGVSSSANNTAINAALLNSGLFNSQGAYSNGYGFSF